MTGGEVAPVPPWPKDGEFSVSPEEFDVLWTRRYVRADGTTRADGMLVGVIIEALRRGDPVAVYDEDRPRRRGVRLRRRARR